MPKSRFRYGMKHHLILGFTPPPRRLLYEDPNMAVYGNVVCLPSLEDPDMAGVWALGAVPWHRP